jgi:hypothetical protein
MLDDDTKWIQPELLMMCCMCCCLLLAEVIDPLCSRNSLP